MPFGYQNEFSLGTGEHIPVSWTGFAARGGCCTEDCVVEYFDADGDFTSKGLAEQYRLKYIGISGQEWIPARDGQAVFSWGEYTIGNTGDYAFSDKTETVAAASGSSVVTSKYDVPDIFWGVVGAAEYPRPRITLEMKTGEFADWEQTDPVFYAPNDFNPANYRMAFAELSSHAYRDLKITILSFADFETFSAGAPLHYPISVSYWRKHVGLDGNLVSASTVTASFNTGDPPEIIIPAPSGSGRVYVSDFETQESTRRLFGQVKGDDPCL